jgi:hypothetical protein
MENVIARFNVINFSKAATFYLMRLLTQNAVVLRKEVFNFNYLIKLRRINLKLN